MTRCAIPVFARFYSRFVVPAMAKQGVEDLRRRTLAGLKGTVVEVGAGDGANFALYPDEVERIVAVEPEPFLRERASGHADERVQLRNAVASSLPVADGEADAVVFTLVLCSVDQAAALAEARRVLRPVASCASSSTSRPTSPGRPAGSSGCWTPRCGPGCSVAATRARHGRRDRRCRVHRDRARAAHLARGRARPERGHHRLRGGRLTPRI